jgi:ABC-2 type transport system permease protein
MTGFGALLRKELLEQWRTTRLPIVAMVFLLVGLSSPLLARFTPELIETFVGDQFQIVLPTPTSADAYDQLAKNLGQFGVLIAVLLAMGSVATEKERGTAALLLTKPVGRGAFLVAKLAAIATTLAISTAIAAAGAWFYTLVLFEPLRRRFRRDRPPMARALAFARSFVGSRSRARPSPRPGSVAAFIVIGIIGIVPAIGRYLPTGLGEPARGLALGQAGVDVLGPRSPRSC